MSDEHDDSFGDAESPPVPQGPARAEPTGPEGVRIIGAEEARAAIEGGQVKRRLSENEPRFGDVPPRPEPPGGRTVRFPLPDDLVAETDHEIVIDEGEEGPEPFAPTDPVAPHGTPSAEVPEPAPPTVRVVRPAVPPDTEVSGPVELPHWTEPPTGEVPRILPESEPDPDEAILEEDDDENLEAWAALGTAPRFRDSAADWEEEDFGPGGELKDDTMSVGALATPVDDDEEFAREVQARRRATRRTPPTGDDGRSRGARGEAAGPATAAYGRNLPIAIATGVGIALVAIACMFLGPPWVAALATAIVAVAAVEVFEGFRRANHQPATLLALLGSVTLSIAAYNRGTAAYPLVFALVVFFTMLWYLAEVVHARPVANVGITLLGFCYVGFFGSFAALILAMPWQAAARIGQNDGVGIILGLAICAVGSDVVGYFVGSNFGRTRIAPHVSPHKTVEGLAAGWVASVVLALVVVHFFQPWSTSWAATLALGALVGVISPIGDFIESMFKRDLGVKDFGTLLPGHGGVMDRFDGILVCLPAVYFLARAFFG